MEDQNNIIEPEEIDNFSLFEDICLRIPYLGEKILRHLDDKSLSNLKLSCKSICAFMQYQRWFWIRIIQRYIGKIEDVDETWQTAIDKGQLISQHMFPDVRCRAVVSGGAGGALAPMEFWSSVYPIPTRGGRLCPPHYC